MYTILSIHPLASLAAHRLADRLREAERERLAAEVRRNRARSGAEARRTGGRRLRVEDAATLDFVPRLSDYPYRP